MFRFARPALAALTVMLATGSALGAPALKPVARVAAGIVTVGDLVDDAGPFAPLPLYRAPDLGTTGTVPASDILGRAAKLGLVGVRTGGIAEVVVTRLAADVTADDLAKRLAAEIAPRLGT
ncbi:hypothetical protein J8J27_22620, partial [Mycobacterium tuberculosis]|nr:hypothetical protein [Mycobacterium tuberculosis]